MIYINGRFLTQPITGVGRFALEICKSLKVNGLQFTVLVPRKYENQIEHTFGFDLKFVGLGNSHYWEQISLGLFMLKQKGALLLSFTGLGPVLYKNKLVTIHDLSFFHNPSWFSKAYYIYYKFFTPLAARTSKKILTVSEFSKDEIIKYLGIKPEKITVVYNGNSFTTDLVEDREHRKKFILGVSSLDARKNHQLLLRVFSRVSSLLDLDLILVGKAEQHFNFNLNTDRLDLSRVKFTGYISDEELEKLYAQATLFVYPSLYEGFGIPPLEAIYFNCPVLISDIPVFREVFQNSATYFDPASEDDLERKILFCLNNPDKIKLTNARRCSLLEKYNWNTSAKKIIELL